MRLLIMGAPGSGKGTQAAAVSERYHIPTISTGDMFRAAVRSESPLGREVKALLDSGSLVPDEITDAVVVARLSEPDAAEGWILDGYPRTTNQVAALDTYLATQGKQLDGVLLLDVPQEQLLERMLLRGQHEGRSDDNLETVTHRLAVYHEQTEPVISQYAPRGILHLIDGSGTIAETGARIVAALDPLTVADVDG
ncbi:MAG: adenylate kinase [Propionibacteriaceae bacterium]|nr:adenylate kinase [Propionibacteriaceae bacterium]